MFGKLALVISVLALALMCAVGATAEGTGASPRAGVLAPVGTAFTYQGQLQSGGAPVNDNCDFQFSLWDAAGSGTPPTGGNQVGSPQPAPSIPVTNGLFAVSLDFGSGAFTGEARWLQTAVRCPAGSGAYTTLAPRQALHPVPYALSSQDLALPFSKSVNSSSVLMRITNNGTGSAGQFVINNPTSSGNALEVSTNGSGAAIQADAGGSGNAINVYARNGIGIHAIVGTTDTGMPGVFSNYNPANSNAVLSGDTNGGGSALAGVSSGSGDTIQGRNTGTGRAGNFGIENPANSSSALAAYTNGSGRAMDASTSGSGVAVTARTTGTGSAGEFGIDNTSNSSNALNIYTNGSGDVIQSRNTGTGRAGNFGIENPANSSNALNINTNGSGDAIQSRNTGTGRAGSFLIENPANSSSALATSTNGSGRAMDASTSGSGVAVKARTTGTGSAGDFRIDNASNSSNSLTANTNGSGWAGSFAASGSGKGVYISVPAGNEGLNVASGTKNAVVATSEGAHLLYTEESSGVWFSDYGFGRLTNGSAFVAIDPLFAETVNLDEPYHAFVQPYGDAELYVSQRTPAGFEVRLRAGDPGVEFSYRLVAARRGYEDTRLERAAWADNDPNLYPAQLAAPQGGGAK